MPTRTHSVQFPTFARKPHRVHDTTMQVAPGVFADSHETEKQFFLCQAFQMQLLAKSAGVKSQYQSELKGLRKGLKATRTRHKQDLTSPSDVPREQIKVQIINEEGQRKAEVVTEAPRMDVDIGNGQTTELEEHNARPKQDTAGPSNVPHEQIKLQNLKKEDQRNTKVITETPRIDVRDGKTTELEEHNARLKTEAKNLTEERDRVQSMYDASEAALVDIVTEYTEMHDQQVREKAKLQEQLSVSENRLKTEESNHNVTRRDLQKSSAESVSKQLALDESASALQKLKAEHEPLKKDQINLRHERDSLKEDLEDLQCENDGLRKERDMAVKAQADAAYIASEKDEQLKALKLELESALAEIKDLRGVADLVEDSTDVENDDTLIGDESNLHGESNPIKVELEHAPASDAEPHYEHASTPSPLTMAFGNLRIKIPVDKLNDRALGSTASNTSIFGSKQQSHVDLNRMVIEPTNPFAKFALTPAQHDSSDKDSDEEEDSDDEAANISDVDFVTSNSQESSVSSNEGEEQSFSDSEDLEDSAEVTGNDEGLDVLEDNFSKLSQDAGSSRDSASPPSSESKASTEPQSPSRNYKSFADLIKASKAKDSTNKQSSVLNPITAAFSPPFAFMSAAEPIKKPLSATENVRPWVSTPLSLPMDEPSQPVPPKITTEPLSKPNSVPEKSSIALRSMPDQSRPVGGMMSSRWAPQTAPSIPAASQEPTKLQSQSEPQHLSTDGRKHSVWASDGGTEVAKHHGQPSTSRHGGRGRRDNDSARQGSVFKGNYERGGRRQRGHNLSD